MLTLINNKQKEYIMASLEDNLSFINSYPEGRIEEFQKLLFELEYNDNKCSLDFEEKALAVESLQDFQCGRFCEFDYEYNDIDNILSYLNQN